jgi:cell wall-associated NlpC family hydrolase
VNLNKIDPKLNHRISTVNAKLDQLGRQSAQLDEQYNVAAAAVAAAKRTATKAQQDADHAEATYRAAHARFVAAVTQQYESGSSPSIGNLLTSSAPQQYLDGLTLANYLSSQFAITVHTEQTARVDAARATRRAQAALAAARAKEAVLAKRRAALQQQSQRFKQLLDSLTARQRQERAHALAVAAAKARAEAAAARAAAARAARRQQAAPQSQQAQSSTPSRTPRRTAPSPAAGVQAVIDFAEAQVGTPYAFGAAGPYAFDCSGLTMQAWARAGVSLPHSAAGQYNYGTHVSYSQLQPGDLIFLYSPISHVEIYVANDLAVSAADPALGIRYVHPSQDMADYAGATRLTG